MAPKIDPLHAMSCLLELVFQSIANGRSPETQLQYNNGKQTAELLNMVRSNSEWFEASYDNYRLHSNEHPAFVQGFNDTANNLNLPPYPEQTDA